MVTAQVDALCHLACLDHCTVHILVRVLVVANRAFNISAVQIEDRILSEVLLDRLCSDDVL